MIGTVSTGQCPMPPARDRSGTLNYFFFWRILKYQTQKWSRNVFCREMESDIKGPNCFDHNLPCFFQVQEGWHGRWLLHSSPNWEGNFLSSLLAYFFVSTSISDGIFQGFTGCGYGHCVGDIVCIGCWTSSNQFKYRKKNLYIFSLTVNMQKDWTALCQINISIC